MMPRRMRKEQLGKVSSTIGTARKSKTKKRRKRKTGEMKNQMKVQWNEEQKLKETLERRRVEVMQKVPEFVVHERMTKGEEVKCTEEKKKVEGWSVEEVSADMVFSLVEIDTEEMIKWRGLSQDERSINAGRIWRKI